MKDVTRKNYSFYMPDDFVEKITLVQANDDSLKALSRSQALYSIINSMAEKIKRSSSKSAEDAK